MIVVRNIYYIVEFIPLIWLQEIKRYFRRMRKTTHWMANRSVRSLQTNGHVVFTVRLRRSVFRTIGLRGKRAKVVEQNGRNDMAI